MCSQNLEEDQVVIAPYSERALHFMQNHHCFGALLAMCGFFMWLVVLQQITQETELPALRHHTESFGNLGAAQSQCSCMVLY